MYPHHLEVVLAAENGESDAESSSVGVQATAGTEPSNGAVAVPLGALRSTASMKRAASAPPNAFTPPPSALALLDRTLVTKDTSYTLDVKDVLLVGKYVPGEELLPPKSNGSTSVSQRRLASAARAYGAAEAALNRVNSGSLRKGSSASRSSVPAPPAKRTATKPAPKSKADDGDDGDDDAEGDRDDDDDVADAPTAEPAPTASKSKVPKAIELSALLPMPLVASIFEGVPGNPSAGTMLYPVAYPPPSRKGAVDANRGSPQMINRHMHAPWPPLNTPRTPEDVLAAGEEPIKPPPGSNAANVPDWRKRSIATSATMIPNAQSKWITVKTANPARTPLYRVGPGAVAFRVVTQAFEANGSHYTPGGVFDYHVAFASEGPTPPPPHLCGLPPSVGWYVRPENRTSTGASFNVLWAKRADSSVHGYMNPYQRTNHFPGSWGIGRKDNLHKNISKMRVLTSDADFNIAPRTFLCPAESQLLRDDAARYESKHGALPTYIVKPVASSCGKGIRVVKGVPESLRAAPTTPATTAAQVVAESAAATKSFVVQHYIDPMLVDGRKFDLRMYCVLTSVAPLRIYLFDQGLVRFAAERYPGPDALLENTWMHLTNYAVNKTAALRKESSGVDASSDQPVDIKWMISDLHDHFLVTQTDRIPEPTPADLALAASRCGSKTPPLSVVRQAQWDRTMANVKDVVIKTLLTVEAEIVSQCKAQCRDPTGRGCFELFGFDLMLDSKLKPHVIEVNIMPSLATAESVDKAVKGRLLAHIATLVGAMPFDRALERKKPTPPIFAAFAAAHCLPSAPTNVRYTSTFTAKQAKAHARRLTEFVSLVASGEEEAPNSAPSRDDDGDSAEDITTLGVDRTTPPPPQPKPPRAERSPRGTTSSSRSSSIPPPSTTPSVVIASKAKNVPLLNLAPLPFLKALRAATDMPLLHDIIPCASPDVPLTLDEVRMIIESEEELQRAGGFERIFPTRSTHVKYSHLMSEGLSRANYVLASWETSKEVIQAVAATSGSAPARRQRDSDDDDSNLDLNGAAA